MNFWEVLGLLGAVMTAASLALLGLILVAVFLRERRDGRVDTRYRQMGVAMDGHRSLAARLREDEEVAALDELWALPAARTEVRRYWG